MRKHGPHISTTAPPRYARRRHMAGFAATVAALLAGLVASSAFAPEATAEEPGEIREIFVPYDDLNVLLQNAPRRVLLDRSQYNELIEQVRNLPEETKPPVNVVLAAAEYRIQVADQRAVIQGRIDVEILDDGLHAVRLPVSQVGVRAASVEGNPLPLGRGPSGELTAFVEGRGHHQLELIFTAQLETAAAEQRVRLGLPHAPATHAALEVAGDVEVKSGVDVVSRQYRKDSNSTLFDVLLPAGEIELVMTLNSRIRRKESMVVARSVLVDELTRAYEQLHATVSLDVLHQAVEQFDFSLPESFEVTDVESPRLARWEVVTEGQSRRLRVHLREPVAEQVILNITALRSPVDVADWTMPHLEPLGVTSRSAVFGVMLDERLQPEELTASGLLWIDTQALQPALRDELTRAVPGRPRVRPIAAWYSPTSDYAVTGRFHEPPPELDCIANTVVTVQEGALRAQGEFFLTPRAERLFHFAFHLPGGWRLTKVALGSGEELSHEVYPAEDGGKRVEVFLPGPVAPGEQTRVDFVAENVPDGWLEAWDNPRQLAFPRFPVEEASRMFGAIAVQEADDLMVRPEVTDRLAALDEAEKKQYGLSGVTSRLAYRYDGPDYRAVFSVEKTQPRITSWNYSFLRIRPDGLYPRYELDYRIERARTDELVFSLPASTPQSVTVQGLDGVALKTYDAEEDGRQRRWTVTLSEPREGRVRLAVEFRQPLPEEGLDKWNLPLIATEGTEYQSGFVSVEGHGELDVELATAARTVDVGELVDAAYQPGGNVLGVYSYVGDTPTVLAHVVRLAEATVSTAPPAVVRHAQVDMILSSDGKSRTQVTYELVSKAAYLVLKLPEASELWAAQLDGEPLRPQMQDDRLLLSIPPKEDTRIRRLAVTYRSDTESLGTFDRVQLQAPKLFLPTADATGSDEVPVADLTWTLKVPSEFEVVRTTGGAYRVQPVSEPALLRVGKGIAALCGPWLLPGGLAARQYSGMSASSAPSADAEFDMSMLRREPDMAAEMELPAMRESGMPAADESLRDAGMAEEFRKGEAEGRLREMHAYAYGGGQTEPPPPPAAEPAAQPAAGQLAQAPTVRKGTRMYEGFRNLQIIPQAVPGATSDFTVQGLGELPQIDVQLSRGAAFGWLAWAVGIALVVLGSLACCRSCRGMSAWAVALLLLATLIPLVPGLEALAPIGDAIVYAVLILVAAALLRWAWGWAKSTALVVGRLSAKLAPRGEQAALWLLAAALSGVISGSVVAQEPAPPKVLDDGRIMVQILDTMGPLNVPDDALLIPYHPDRPADPRTAERIFVPYDRYMELWRKAHPELERADAEPPADFAMTAARLEGALADEDSLTLRGVIEIEVYREGTVEVPLGVENAGIVDPRLDGRPATLGLMAPVEPSPINPPQQPAQPQAESQAALPAGSLVVLHVSGEGSHRLAFDARIPLGREGGWRTADFTISGGPGAALVLNVPRAQTEVRFADVPDRLDYLTGEDDATIQTTLSPSGRARFRWRPEVAAGQVDRALSSQSMITFDVAEDGIRVTWDVNLAFPQSQRDAFGLRIPTGWHVLGLSGQNVRGWDLREDTENQVQWITVDLLAPAKNAEGFTVQLWQDAQIVNESATFEVPRLAVDGAALQRGTIVVRHSPRLDVHCRPGAGVSRTELPEGDYSPVARTVAEESPLGLQALEAYRFTTPDVQLSVQAAIGRTQISGSVQSVFRIASYSRSLEAQVRFWPHAGGAPEPIHHVSLLLPEETTALDDLEVPAGADWSTTERDGRTLLHVWFPRGQQNSFTVLLQLTLQREAIGETFSLPKLELPTADSSNMDMAVLIDPVYRIEAQELAGCRVTSLDRLGWLKPELRSYARLAISASTDDYEGTLSIQRRTPRVTCETITNVRFTERSIEDVILLDFDIVDAGIRELQFKLPASMQGCRITAPMLRTEDVTPTAEGDGAPLQVRLTFQDEVLGLLRVLVENDRLVSRQEHTAPIPFDIQTGGDAVVRIGERYVCLQNVGRDEVVESVVENVEVLSVDKRKQLRRRLELPDEGGYITSAYRARAGDVHPNLVFRVRSRPLAQLAPVRIRMAECALTFAPDGAYRAEQVYWAENRSEQFLAVAIPSGSRLWSATVDGKPVKPLLMDPQQPDRIHVPIIRTAPGDLPYEIRLKYGGKAEPLATLSHVAFPLIEPVDVTPEWSQLRLYLPEEYRWLHFDGSMRPAEEGDLAAGFADFQAKVASDLLETVRHGDLFSRVRAQFNAMTLAQSYGYSGGSGGPAASKKAELAKLKASTVLREVEEALSEEEVATSEQMRFDNSAQLGRLYERQQVQRGRNVVDQAANNWDETAPPPRQEGRRLNRGWYAQLGLQEQAAEQADDKAGTAAAAKKPMAPESKSRVLESQFEAPQPEEQDALMDQLQTPGAARRPAAPAQTATPADQPAEKLQRYQERYAGQQQMRSLRGGEAAQDHYSDYGSVAGRRQGAAAAQGGYGGAPAAFNAMPQSGMAGIGGGAGGAGAAGPADDARTAGDRMSVAFADAQANGQLALEGEQSAMLEQIVSLDVDIPRRGKLYCFVAPQGEASVGGWATPADSTDRLGYAGGAILALVIVLAVLVFLRRVLARWLATWKGSLAVAAVGVLLFCILPVPGLLLLAAGLVALIHSGARTATA